MLRLWRPHWLGDVSSDIEKSLTVLTAVMGYCFVCDRSSTRACLMYRTGLFLKEGKSLDETERTWSMVIAAVAVAVVRLLW